MQVGRRPGGARQVVVVQVGSLHRSTVSLSQLATPHGPTGPVAAAVPAVGDTTLSERGGHPTVACRICRVLAAGWEHQHHFFFLPTPKKILFFF